MAQTQVRIEIPYDLYKVLVSDQEKLRKADGKKPALSLLILSYCNQWLKARAHPEVLQGLTDIQPPVPLPEPPKKPGIIPLSYEELRDWENDLRDRDEQVHIREMEIIERDQLVSEKAENILQIKEKIIDEKEKSMNQSIDIAIQKRDCENLLKDDASKKQMIADLKNENINLKKEVLVMLRNINRNTEKSIFWNKILPFLPMVATLISTIVLKKQKNSNDELGTLEKEIFDLYTTMKPDVQKGFGDFIQNLMMEYREKNSDQKEKK